MKITLHLDQDTVVLLNSMLSNVYALGTWHSQEKEARLLWSIAFDLADKFNSKFKTQLKKQNLFEVHQKTKISLKYHEAWALEGITLHWLTDIVLDAYQLNKLNLLVAQINQKLA